jgi:hypothetical protein
MGHRGHRGLRDSLCPLWSRWPPPQPHRGLSAGGAGSRGATRARNGHTTALSACECQSFLDNLIAGLRQIGAWNDPRPRFPPRFGFTGFGHQPDFRLTAAGPPRRAPRIDRHSKDNRSELGFRHHLSSAPLVHSLETTIRGANSLLPTPRSVRAAGRAKGWTATRLNRTE